MGGGIFWQAFSSKESIDAGKPGLGPVAHSDRDGPVQIHDRRRVRFEQRVVKRYDLPPGQLSRWSD